MTPRVDPIALVMSLAQTGASTFLPLPPTDVDLHDRGGRQGVEAARFLARRALLRQMIGRRLGVEPSTVVVGYDPRGCPVLRAPLAPLWCSVSARRDHVALSIAGSPVGIDLEPVKPEPIPWTALSEGERDYLDALPSDQRNEAFLVIWTLKEAYVKALGTGFAQDPAAIEVLSALPNLALRANGTPIDGLRGDTRLVIQAGRMIRVACVVLP